jgi:XTP/dITP diphosphohydrolase
MKFYLASGNPHKVAELQQLAQASKLPIEVVSAAEVGGMPPVEENMGTFVGNARKKAWALREKLPFDAWALADDSGLCVDALEGKPGVDSAYYAGPKGDPAANLAKLVMVMRNVPSARRTAYFTCVLLALGPNEEEYIFEGGCSGRLLPEPKGKGGFGYDPLFKPTGFKESYAELGDDVKSTISHRFRAWTRLAEWVRSRENPKAADGTPAG